MTPIQQLLLGVGAGKKTYSDEVFSTYLYRGNANDQTINNGLDLSGEGGLTWIKRRDATQGHAWVDTVRGPGLRLSSSGNMSNGSYTAANNNLSTFTSSGFTLKDDDGNDFFNKNNTDYSSWSFRKAPGFFDIVTWTQSGSNGSARTISHNLGCVPGFIMLKQTTGNENWITYHRDFATNAYIKLNSNHSIDTSANASVNSVSSTEIVVGADNNKVGTYIAYLFAGGESTAATARSVDFDGTGDALVSNTSTDYVIGTNDFTVEFWIKMHYNFGGAQVIFDQNKSSNNATTPFQIYGESQKIHFGTSSSHISQKITSQSWNHIALVRSSGTTTMYINGTAVKGTYSDSNNYDSNQITIGAAGENTATQNMSAWLSNVRLVVGTAVYTSSFRPPTEPLTNITNTKFLACQNSTTTGCTVGTIQAADGNPSASTDSPFDDPAGFAFGNSKEGIVKCGTYLGNGNADGPEIYLGWEPQWWLVRFDGLANWQLVDSMRGWFNGVNDEYIAPNNGSAESSYNFGHPTSTGFKLTDSSNQNASGGKYYYVAIRRPDGYVGKPAEAGTDVFAMDTGAGNSIIPNFDSGFPVDFATARRPGSSEDWYTASRHTGKYNLTLNGTASEADAGASDWVFDHNSGWNSGSGYNSNYQSWMWKRGAGFDLVTYKGSGQAREIPHSLNKAPEMIWIKIRSGSAWWYAGHKGLNGGTDPWDYYLKLNTNDSQIDSAPVWNDTAPTSTHFTLGNGDANTNYQTYIAMLFASVKGVSHVGYYSGSGSSQTITIPNGGFQPRFVIIKKVSGSGANRNWYTLDTTRGWGSGNDKVLLLSDNDAQTDDTDMGAPTSTGFTLTGETHTGWNAENCEYIYYAHA